MGDGFVGSITDRLEQLEQWRERLSTTNENRLTEWERRLAALETRTGPVSVPTVSVSACDERCRVRCDTHEGLHPFGEARDECCRNPRCDGTGPAHRPAAAATAEPERTDTPSVPPSGSVAPAVPTTGRLVAVGTCYSHPTWGDHEHEAGCINWCWSVRYGMSAAPPAPVFALTEWEREHVRIGLAAGKGSLVGTLARLAVRALAALGVPLDGEGSR